jgi:AcrR family transcriptional regulator
MTDHRIEKGEKTRDNIMDAAIAIIAANGLHDISTAKLAGMIGVSKSTIFHHFKSREDVLTGALNTVFERLRQVMSEESYTSVEHFLDALGQTLHHVTQSDMTVVKAFLAFFHGGIFHPEIRSMLASFAERMNERFRMQLAQLAPKTVSQANVDAVSMLLLPMIDGIGFHLLLSGNDVKFRRVWQLQTKGLLYLLNDPEGEGDLLH